MPIPKKTLEKLNKRLRQMGIKSLDKNQKFQNRERFTPRNGERLVDGEVVDEAMEIETQFTELHFLMKKLSKKVRKSFPRHSPLYQKILRMKRRHRIAMTNYPTSVGLVTITVTNGEYPSEVSWGIVQGATEILNGGPDVIVNQLFEPDSYIFQARDSWGDGWNGATFIINDSTGVIQSGTLEDGSVEDFSFTIDVPAENVELVYYRLLINSMRISKLAKTITKSVPKTSDLYRKIQQVKKRYKKLLSRFSDFSDSSLS